MDKGAAMNDEPSWRELIAANTHVVAQHMMVRGLIERDHAATRYALADLGRAVLGALLATR
jgi:hypothetical protein